MLKTFCEESQPPAGYFGHVNPDLLDALPITAKRVLEIGCGEGALGAAFKRRQPQVVWTGVELAPTPAATALGHIEQCYVADAEAEPSDLPWALWAGAMDVVVLGDVIEHFRDPWRMLARLARCLAPKGVLVACVPNVGHWSVIEQLLHGQFSYQSQGLLDRTHLRFFTASSILELLSQAGLCPIKMRSREFVLEQPRFDRFFASMQAWLQQEGGSAAAFKQRLLTLQYVVRAVPRPSSTHPAPVRRMVIAVLAMAPAFADVRTRLPLAAFASMPDIEVHYFERSAQLPDLPPDLPKVLIVQRQLPQDPEQWAATVKQLGAKGWLVMAEWDDHPDLFAPRIRRSFDQAPWASVMHAHGVITSTALLAHTIRKVRGDQRVLCFENCLLELPRLSDKKRIRHGPQNRLGVPASEGLMPGETVNVFYGALNRTAEGSSLMRALKPIFDHHQHLHLTVMQDRQVFEAAAIERKAFIAASDYQGYQQCLAGCDIALLPLAPNKPNACKSDLKFIECGANELACIASPTAYDHTIRHGETGLVAESEADFVHWLDALAKDRGRIEQLGQAARRYVAEQRLLSQHLEVRVDALFDAWQAWR